MTPSVTLVNAISALERASGVLEALERPEDAQRCLLAASELRFVFVEQLEELEEEEQR
jgi:hypothetical protein